MRLGLRLPMASLAGQGGFQEPTGLDSSLVPEPSPTSPAADPDSKAAGPSTAKKLDAKPPTPWWQDFKWYAIVAGAAFLAGMWLALPGFAAVIVRSKIKEGAAIQVSFIDVPSRLASVFSSQDQRC